MNSSVKMKVQYYSINEIINILEKKSFDADLNHVRSCIRENIINPIFYIDSIPAYAFEKIDSRAPAIIGLCFLTAYWNPDNGRATVFDAIARDDNTNISYKIESDSLINKSDLINWQYNEAVFAKAQGYRIHPKPYSDHLKIDFFMLIEKLTLNNVLISIDEINNLIAYLEELESSVSSSTNTTKDETTLRREENNLLAGIGYLAKLVANCSPKLKRGEKPNALQISKMIMDMVKADNLVGEVELDSFNRTITRGLNHLQSIKS